jgi:hypothetical protein
VVVARRPQGGEVMATRGRKRNPVAVKRSWFEGAVVRPPKRGVFECASPLPVLLSCRLGFAVGDEWSRPAVRSQAPRGAGGGALQQLRRSVRRYCDASVPSVSTRIFSICVDSVDSVDLPFFELKRRHTHRDRDYSASGPQNLRDHRRNRRHRRSRCGINTLAPEPLRRTTVAMAVRDRRPA